MQTVEKHKNISKQSNSGISSQSNKEVLDSEHQMTMLADYFKTKYKKYDSNGNNKKPVLRKPVNYDFNKIPLFPPQTAIIQPKLKINQPNDKYEQEADAMAEKVTRITNKEAHIIEPKGSVANNIQRKCAKCEEEENKKLHRKETNNSTPIVSNAVHQTLQSSGKPLDKTTRSFMEQRFDFDFGKVQIHDNPLAHQSVKDINALAYTHQHHIAFGSGHYQPQTKSGRKLLAHELTHVVQQNRGLIAEVAQRSVDEDEIDGADPRFSFSTRCGWIDWSHANAGMTSQIIPAITQVSDNMRSSGTTDPQPVTTPSMDSSGGPLLLSSVTPTFNIKRPLSSDEIRSVALRVFMLQSLAFENLQQWTDFIGESSFSAEDLPSNIIAFYMGVDNLSRDDIGTICDVWSPEDSLSEFQSNQPSSRNRTFRPLRSSHTTGWPAELSSITPAVIGGPLMDEPMGTLRTFGGSSRDINLAHYNDLLAGNYHIVSVTGSNTIDISSEESSSAAGNHFEIDGLPASHNFVFRWNILDNDGDAYAMWSDSGQVHQYGNANDAYIGSGTRALFRERNITSVTVNCRVAIANARQYNQLFSLRINLTW